jgi:hypothetical protein
LGPGKLQFSPGNFKKSFKLTTARPPFGQKKLAQFFLPKGRPCGRKILVNIRYLHVGIKQPLILFDFPEKTSVFPAPKSGLVTSAQRVPAQTKKKKKLGQFSALLNLGRPCGRKILVKHPLLAWLNKKTSYPFNFPEKTSVFPDQTKKRKNWDNFVPKGRPCGRKILAKDASYLCSF